MTKLKKQIMSVSLATCLLLSGCDTIGTIFEEKLNLITEEEKPKNTLFREGLLAVKDGDRWGYIDESGEFIIEPQFYYAYNFMSNGLAIASNGNGFGLIDKNGNYILEPTYGTIEEFDESGIAKVGFYRVNNQNKVQYDVGLINEKGECILEAKYTNIGDFNKFGWALVDNFLNYDYVNTKGEFMLGEEMLITGAREYFDSEGWTKVSSYYTSGYYDSNGNQVIPIQYHSLGNFASNGLAFAQKDAFDKYGYIDRKQNYVIPAKFDKVMDFDKSGFAAVNIGFEPNYDPMTDMKPLSLGKWGFIDEKGNYIIEPKYDEVVEMRNGRAIVKLNEKYGYINLTENNIIEPIYDNIVFLNYDGAASVTLNNKIGLIDKNENLVTELKFTSLQFTSLSQFKKSVGIYGYQGKMGYISDSGEILTEPIFTNLNFFNKDGYAQAATENGWGVIDDKYNFVIQPQSWVIGDFSDKGLARVRYIPEGTSYIGELNGTNYGVTPFGYINQTGEIVVDFIYYSATDFYDDGYAIVQKDEKYYILKSNGEKAFESSFEEVQEKFGGRIPTYYY